MAASVAFYRRLGLTVEAEPDAFHVNITLANGLRLELDTVDFAGRWDRGRSDATGGTTVLGFSLPSREAVDDLYGELVGAGHRGHQPPYDAFWGARYAIVDDPDGNPVGLMSPIEPAAKFWPPSVPPAPGEVRFAAVVVAVRDNPLRRFMRWTGSLKPMSLLYARTLHRVDRRVYELSRGRATFSAWAAGLPVVMLETTGAKSGRRRSLPVLGLPDGEDLIVIASNYGQRRHPAWYHNLRAHPRARVTIDGRTREVEAVEVTDPDERERIFEEATRVALVFSAYRKRTDRIGRRIPVVRLRPADGPAPAGAS